MFYVGMTRARHRLYLFWTRRIHNKEMDPSRFLPECQRPQRRKQKQPGLF